MNLILLFDDDFIDTQRVRLDGRRAQHVRAVQRAAVGDTLRVGRLNGPLGSGRVVAIDDAAIVLDVALDRDPPPPAGIALLLALPRPKALRRVLQCVAAFGIKEIVLLNTWRVEKSFWESPALGDEDLRAQLLLGLEQGADTIVPRVEPRRRFRPFVEDELGARLDGRRALVAHPAADAPCPHGVDEALWLAVGPEGGFIPYEIEMLQAHGFDAVTLGRRPLRVEHAVPALLGRLLP